MEKTLQIDVNYVIEMLKQKLADALLENCIEKAKVQTLEAQLDEAVAYIAKSELPVEEVANGNETED